MTLRATSGNVHSTYQQGLILESYNVSFAKGVENFVGDWLSFFVGALFIWRSVGIWLQRYIKTMHMHMIASRSM